MVLLSEKLHGGLTRRPPTPLPGALPASSRGAEKDQGLPLTRSFLPHAGLPHYRPQHWPWPTIRGESHAAHTLSILLLNSMNCIAAQGIFCLKSCCIKTTSGGQTVHPFVVMGSCMVVDTDLWLKETVYNSCRGHKNLCNKKARHYGWYLLVTCQEICLVSGKSFLVDYFQAWQRLPKGRVHECMVVTPRDAGKSLHTGE